VVIVPILSAAVLRRQPAPEAVLGVILATVGLAALTLDGNLEVTAGRAVGVGLFALICASYRFRQLFCSPI
jgi:drug/metabolite transporter (DMT)-like permease